MTATASRPRWPFPTQGRRARPGSLATWRRGAAVFCIYLVYAWVDLVQHHTWPAMVLGFAISAAFLLLYLGVGPATVATDDTRGTVLTLAGMVALIGLYLGVLGGAGTVFVVYFVVFFALAQPPMLSVPVTVVLGVAVVYGPQHVPAWDMRGAQWSVGGPVLLAGAAMLLLRSNRRAAMQLAAADAEIAALAAGQERLRIARDLHDLLGHTLTTVTVKAELAARLADRDPARAAAEMREVAGLARQGLADVRSTVAGYREVSLALELATAREVLAAAGVRAELPASADGVPGELRGLFGWVVREGVTNAVRHAHARSVRVTLTAEAVEVVDDGAGCAGPRHGSGLSGLAERVAAAGGELHAGPAAGGGFRLRAEVPA